MKLKSILLHNLLFFLVVGVPLFWIALRDWTLTAFWVALFFVVHTVRDAWRERASKEHP